MTIVILAAAAAFCFGTLIGAVLEHGDKSDTVVFLFGLGLALNGALVAVVLL